MIHSTSKIINPPDLAALIEGWRQNGEKIVFTNGCFDLLHLGHIDYLEKTRTLGTKMIVGLNADKSVGRLKGSYRPLQDQISRARILAALEVVDAVVLFEEDTPENLIKQVVPDVLVKGDDYTVEEIVGHDFVRENGGEVKTVPFLEGYSTSELIKKARNIPKDES